MIKIISYSLFGLLFLVAGIKLSKHAHEIIHVARESENWAPTEATVTYFEIKIRPGGGSNGSNVHPEIAYDYKVAEKQYHGTRISLAATNNARFDRPHVGKIITIYYLSLIHI